MPGMHILQALREKKSDQALFQTCTYLATNDTDALEDEWIAVLGEIGMSSSLVTSKFLWIQMLAEVSSLIEAEALDITDALVFTTKLYLLYQRTATSSPDSLTRLRSQVIDHFPDNVQLSYKGVSLFAQILPSDENEELHAFGHRILSGFIKLFHGKHASTANAVEFIARKKCAIKLPKVWPAPNPQEAGKGDPVWFVWGAVLLYFPNDIYVQVAWSLFCLRWKKKYKMERLGLLVGAAACVTSSANTSAPWTSEEIKVIENINLLAPDLWAAHTPPPVMPAQNPYPQQPSRSDSDRGDREYAKHEQRDREYAKHEQREYMDDTDSSEPDDYYTAPQRVTSSAIVPVKNKQPRNPRPRKTGAGRAAAAPPPLEREATDFLTNFIPRRTSYDPDPNILALPSSPYDPQIRVISIKNDKKKGARE
jgi:hypothetical protein